MAMQRIWFTQPSGYGNLMHMVYGDRGNYQAPVDLFECTDCGIVTTKPDKHTCEAA